MCIRDRCLVELSFLDLKQEIYSASTSSPNLLLVNPQTKAKLSQYLYGSSTARIATPEQQVPAMPKRGGTVIGAVDFWYTDFGMVRITPARNLNSNVALLLDPEYWAVSYLRPFRKENLPQAGDSKRFVLLADYALCSKNEAANGVIHDIDADAAITA